MTSPREKKSPTHTKKRWGSAGKGVVYRPCGSHFTPIHQSQQEVNGRL